MPAEELDTLTAGYEPLIEARELSVADKRRLQVYLAQRGQVGEAEAAKKQLEQSKAPPEVMSTAEQDALVEQLRALGQHPWEVMQDRFVHTRRPGRHHPLHLARKIQYVYA